MRSLAWFSPVRQKLQVLFPGRVPPRSPDLTPLDYFLPMKKKVYAIPPPNLESLKRRIEFEIYILRQNRQMLVSVMHGMLTRANRCIEVEGVH